MVGLATAKDTANVFSTALSRAGPMIRASQCCWASWRLFGDRRDLAFASLRTDSVNRGLCISLLMLAIVVLGDSLELFLFFFVIPQY
jgi:hypothetical protein